MCRNRRLVIGAAHSPFRPFRADGDTKGREKPFMPTQIADVGADALREAKSNLDSDYVPSEDEEFMNPQQLAAMVKTEYGNWAQVVKSSKIEAE